MRIIAVNGTYRPKGTTSRLAEAALAGAASEGARTEHVLLVRKDIRYCTNCLACYRDLESDTGPCPIRDDVPAILDAVRGADGLILASPVHAGLMTALMFAFLERATFMAARPTGTAMGMKGCPEPRLRDRPRAVATIASAGCATAELRHTCDMVTPLLGWYGACLANGLPLANMYAAACFPRPMRDEDWSRAFLLRELTQAQLEEARTLGVNMARAVKAGELKPYSSAFFEQPAP